MISRGWGKYVPLEKTQVENVSMYYSNTKV